MTSIAVVVPSNRPERLQEFEVAWRDLFHKHGITLYRVLDGDDPQVWITNFGLGTPTFDEPSKPRLSEAPEAWRDVVYNKNDGVRNFGFLFATKQVSKIDVILTLDDDVKPIPNTDPIQAHLEALDMEATLGWMTTYDPLPRGFPYTIRGATDVWVSHGVWTNVPDYDAPSQLVCGKAEGLPTRGPIPAHNFFPMCGMNLAFKIDALPYLYFAPCGPSVNVYRFADIWAGLRLKLELDRLSKAIVTGYAAVEHTRASNVFVNLEQEAKGIRWNEVLWKNLMYEDSRRYEGDEEMVKYIRLWDEKYHLWRGIVKGLLS